MHLDNLRFLNLFVSVNQGLPWLGFTGTQFLKTIFIRKTKAVTVSMAASEIMILQSCISSAVLYFEPMGKYGLILLENMQSCI